MYADYVIWKSMEYAMAVEQAMMKSDAAGIYSSFINPNTMQMYHMSVIEI